MIHTRLRPRSRAVADALCRIYVDAAVAPLICFISPSSRPSTAASAAAAAAAAFLTAMVRIIAFAAEYDYMGPCRTDIFVEFSVKFYFRKKDAHRNANLT